MKKLVILVLTIVTAMCFVFSACFDNSGTTTGGNTGEHTQQSGDNNNQNEDGDIGDDNSQSDGEGDNKDEQPDDGNKDDNQGSGEDNEDSDNIGDNQQGEQGGQESDGDTDDNNELVNTYQDIVDALKTRLAEIKRTDRDLIEIISIYIDNGRFACVAKNNNENGATYAYRFLTIYADNIDEVTSEEILEANKSLFQIVGRNYNKGAETYETNPELLEAMTKKLVGEDYEIITAGLTEPDNAINLGNYVFRFYALLKNKETKQICTYETGVTIDEAKVFNRTVYETVLNSDYENFKISNNNALVVLYGSEVYELECERVEEAKKAAENK